jgi:hypothetical protein
MSRKGKLDETYQRHRAPIERALTPQEAQEFTWKRSYGEIQTYEHDRTHGRAHIDPQGPLRATYREGSGGNEFDAQAWFSPASL